MSIDNGYTPIENYFPNGIGLYDIPFNFRLKIN